MRQNAVNDDGLEPSPLERAIAAAGGLDALAEATGVTKQAVHKWRRHRVPAERVLSVERATGIPRHELRPDLYPEPVTQ